MIILKFKQDFDYNFKNILNFYISKRKAKN